MSAEFEQLVAEFEKFQSKIKKAETQFAKVGEMQEELAELESVAASPDRSITVVAGPGGSVKDIRLSPEALRQQPQQLAASILSTLHTAVADAARKQAGIVDAQFGEAFHLNVEEQVLEAQAEALGTTSDDLRSQMSEEPPQDTARPAGRRPRDEGDFSEESVLRRSDEPNAGPQQPGGSSAGDQFLKNLFDDQEEH
ncbi:YbaB/EbfC family nucleoid-associated protein [Amycolatopsis pittospori]|uniref:YbaB/EbfC family nucleoid-associated protein n=1 Tax=Amycolatopsis pittospori TaxID=2749434 RepID=UPI0015F0707E|nr:YbaB/EbfC family nucleoid-associated protein [Amycolatopsis pittospori]